MSLWMLSKARPNGDFDLRAGLIPSENFSIADGNVFPVYSVVVADGWMYAVKDKARNSCGHVFKSPTGVDQNE